MSYNSQNTLVQARWNKWLNLNSNIFFNIWIINFVLYSIPTRNISNTTSCNSYAFVLILWTFSMQQKSSSSAHLQCVCSIGNKVLELMAEPSGLPLAWLECCGFWPSCMFVPRTSNPVLVIPDRRQGWTRQLPLDLDGSGGGEGSGEYSDACWP